MARGATSAGTPGPGSREGPVPIIFGPLMPGLLDHLLFAALVLLGPVWARTFGYRRLLRASAGELSQVRLSVYRGAMAIQWTLAAAALVLWAARQRPWPALGLDLPPTPGLAGVLAGSAIVIALVWRQRAGVLRSDDGLADVRERMRHVEPMLPHSRPELNGFYLLSLTAGICEELLFRGFMLWYLNQYMALIPAVAVAAVVFGVGHAYQGSRGIVLTGIVGAFFAAVYLVSGSLFPGMLLHALMDAHSGHLAHVALVRGAERDAARAEAEPGLPEPPPPAGTTERGTAPGEESV